MDQETPTISRQQAVQQILLAVNEEKYTPSILNYKTALVNSLFQYIANQVLSTSPRQPESRRWRRATGADWSTTSLS